MTQKDNARLDSQVRDDCWLYAGYCNYKGYGMTWVGDKKLMTHRVIYEALVGEIPEGLTIDHLCKVKACINPDHLEPVTQRENNLRSNDMAGKNARKTHCVNGHKLSGDNIRMYEPKNERVCLACQSIRGKLRRKLRQMRAVA